jgi:hypothetical protein
MKVIAHQAVSVNLKFRLQASFRQGLQEILPVHIVQEDSFSSIPATHHVIDGSRIFESQLARHGARLDQTATPFKAI